MNITGLVLLGIIFLVLSAMSTYVAVRDADRRTESAVAAVLAIIFGFMYIATIVSAAVLIIKN